MEDHKPKYFDDDGTEINQDLIPNPSLCVSCKKDGMPGGEDVLCDQTRSDQQGDTDFHCDAYELKDELDY